MINLRDFAGYFYEYYSQTRCKARSPRRVGRRLVARVGVSHSFRSERLRPRLDKGP